MRLIQHKKEAYWFYRFLSLGYDRYVNPLFWTARMRAEALELARLDRADLRTADVGAGTGFATEGVVARVDPARVTMLDQSPHQIARARAKPALDGVEKVLGDAEDLPFGTDELDRYVSTGSIEYWPDPQRAIAEAYRVLKPGGVAMLAGPLPPGNPIARRLADAWMLFPPEAAYRQWFERAGFDAVSVRHIAPDWHRAGAAPYALAIAGTKPAPGASPASTVVAGRPERLQEPMTVGRSLRFAGRFAAGSLAGALFVPIAAALEARHRLGRRRGG
jgi:MPBQ/MSBQ methyltransferase